MLGVPPKSSGGATNRRVMSRLTKCLASAPFSARSARLTWATHQHVDHDPATPWVNDQRLLVPGSCALSFRCGGAGVHRLCALRSRGLSVGHADVLAAGPDNAGYRGLGPRFCSQRYCNSLTGTSDDRPRSQAAVNQPTRNSAPPSTGSATPVMKLASTHARGFSSPLVGPRSRFLASSRWTCSRFLVSSCRPSRFRVSSCRPLAVSRLRSSTTRGSQSPLVDYSRFPGSSSPRAVESIHSTSRISSYSAELEI